MARLGFSGVGWLGASLVSELPAFPELALGAVQDASPEVASAVAFRHGAPLTVGSFEELVALPQLDAIVISTPNALHAEQARAALAAGKHVLVQKPLATSAADAHAVAAAARAAGRLLMVDHTYRFLETTRRFVAAARECGPIRSVRATFHNVYGPAGAWARDPALAGGGALMDLGVHLIDLALALLSPRDVALLSAELGRGRGLAVEDAAACVLRLDDVVASVGVSWQTPLAATEIRIAASGDSGAAAWENVGGSFYRFRATKGSEVLLELETTLRADTLRTFAGALRSGVAPDIDLRAYEIIDRAYGRA